MVRGRGQQREQLERRRGREENAAWEEEGKGGKSCRRGRREKSIEGGGKSSLKSRKKEGAEEKIA